MFGPLIDQIYRDRVHQQSSVTKTFASAVFGVALDKGYIKDVNEPVFNYFPEYSQFRDEQKDRILLKHVLTMTTGLKWDENAYSYSDPRSDLYQWSHSDDLLKFYLERPFVAEPGETFSYSCACTMLLGEIIKRTTGSYIDEFDERTLFKDLGISNYSWLNGDTLISINTGGLSVRPRDMAKLGQLFLNDGKWNGRQIISEDWVRESIRAHKVLRSGFFGDKKSYGYQWWQRTCQIKKGKTLDINLKSGGSLDIRGWDQELASIQVIFERGDPEDFDFDVQNKNSGIMIRSGFNRRVKNSNIRVSIKIPEKFNIKIETSGGGVSFYGIEGEIKGSTGGGGLDFSNLSGDIHFTTGGGSITIKDSQLDGRVSTGGGKVLVENVFCFQ